jgi:hypothetical protein
MNHYVHRASALVVAIFLGYVGFSALAATEIAGTYQVSGTYPNGRAYTGSLLVVKTFETYQLTWKIAGITYGGTGLLVGNVLSVAYTIPGQRGCGVVAYTINGRNLNGVWADCGASLIYNEVASR